MDCLVISVPFVDADSVTPDLWDGRVRKHTDPAVGHRVWQRRQEFCSLPSAREPLLRRWICDDEGGEGLPDGSVIVGAAHAADIRDANPRGAGACLRDSGRWLRGELGFRSHQQFPAERSPRAGRLVFASHHS
jgi:hypothetical protein